MSSPIIEIGNNSGGSLAMRFAIWVWGSSKTPHSENMSPELCISGFPFNMTWDCYAQLWAKIMGLYLIVAGTFVKTPIIRNVWNAKSGAGLSRLTIYGETIVYANSAFYGYLRGLPFTTYGEYFALVVQASTLVGLTWWFSGDSAMAKVTRREQIIVIGVAIAYVLVATQLIPESKYYWLTSSSLPILLCARGSQIRKTHLVKHTGAQSIISTSMSLGGASTRVLTTIREVGWDFGLMTPFFLGICLNSIVFTQYILYYDNTKQVLEKLRLEREAKKKT